MSETTRTYGDAFGSSLRDWIWSEAIDPSTGGLVAWKDMRSRKAAFEYPEIEGYGLTFAAWNEPLSEDEAGKAWRLASRLVERCSEPTERLHSPSRACGHLAYTFDQGMIASGLISYGKTVGRGDCLEVGLRIAGGIARRVTGTGRGSSLVPGIGLPCHRRWSSGGDAHLAKVCQPLLAAAAYGDDRARSAADILCGQAIARQRPSGAFESQPVGDDVMLHPHLYACEGLWMYSEAVGDVRARDAAVGGILWARAQQLPSGGYPRCVDGALSGPEQGDVTAQALRLLGLLLENGDDQRGPRERLAAIAVSAGGALAVPYQPGAREIHANTWATMFACQALAVTRHEHSTSHTPMSWDLLV